MLRVTHIVHFKSVHSSLNRKLRVHFGHLGRFLEILDPKLMIHITKCKSVQFSHPRYPLHEPTV